jgi:hypothetical protein
MRTFCVDRKPKDLSFFTEGEKDGRKNKHGQAMLNKNACNRTVVCLARTVILLIAEIHFLLQCKPYME